MTSNGKNILTRFLIRWRSLVVLEIILYALGTSALLYFLTENYMIASVSFLAIGLILLIVMRPWQYTLRSTSSYLDSRIDSVEYSTGLLLLPTEKHSSLARLQQQRVSERLEEAIKKTSPPNHLIRSIMVATFLIVLGFLYNYYNLGKYAQGPNEEPTPENAIIFRTKDSLNPELNPPKLVTQWATITYPEYTNKSSFTTSDMDLRVLKGSRVFWRLEFDAKVTDVVMEQMDEKFNMTLKNGAYRKSKTISNSILYNFKFSDTLSNVYSSDLYTVDVFPDKAPEVNIESLKQFTSFNHNDEKSIRFNTLISDDFGISDAYIIATVSKGSGESVKFREEKITFPESLVKGAKQVRLSKELNLDDLKMEPGDELYFYVEASDLKQPRKNFSRSETYFAAIKDTTSYEFGVEGNLGVDRMPDYFRSQRQLIIDTEQLISEKDDIPLNEFKFRSNELGFDQKALRLKYGEFMGVESESGLDIQEESPEAEDDHDHEAENEDPLAEYTHDHDGDNEHNLVETETEDGKTSKNPLQEFMHDHGDPEMATLFEESLKVKMHKAMNEMWDAELYLRLYEPKKSLPYQYKALKLIQEIKNHARIYVHRIGFDPPPIKEDKRLTGKHLDKITGFTKSENLALPDKYIHVRQSIAILEEIVQTNRKITNKVSELLEKTALELSALAIESPGSHLRTLQNLKRLIEGLDTSVKNIKTVQQGLLYALPAPENSPIKSSLYVNEIDKLLLKELN